MPAIAVGTARMAAQPASRRLTSLWRTASWLWREDSIISPASKAKLSISRKVSICSSTRFTWSTTSR
jgi:hypothetical protein